MLSDIYLWPHAVLLFKSESIRVTWALKTPSLLVKSIMKYAFKLIIVNGILTT